MDNEKLIEFLTELTKLTNKYEFQIGGCGCCGSPWVTSNGRDGGVRLEYDEEKGCYRVDLYDGYDYHEPIYVYGDKEDKMNHLYEEIDEHIQWLINFMNEEYPNNYELVIDNNSGTIRSTLQAQMFLRNDLRNPEGFRSATEKPMDKFVEKLAEMAKEHYDNTLCECWLSDYGNCRHYCNGTKEREICHCNGDVKKCDFYPEKRGEQKWGVTWRTLSYPEMKSKLIELFGYKDMSFLDMVSALYWAYIEAIGDEQDDNIR